MAHMSTTRPHLTEGIRKTSTLVDDCWIVVKCVCSANGNIRQAAHDARRNLAPDHGGQNFKRLHSMRSDRATVQGGKPACTTLQT